MKETAEKPTETQGVNVAETKETVERKPSKLYAMKSFANIVKKVHELEMVTKEQKKQLDSIYNTMLNGYLLNDSNPEIKK